MIKIKSPVFLERLANTIGQGGKNVLTELSKTIRVIRIWIPIATIAFIIFLFGFLYLLFRLLITK